MKRAIALCMVLLSSTAVRGLAQAGGPPPPPNVLVIAKEEVKVGRGAEHANYEAGWPTAYTKYKDPTNYLAMTSTSGPNEAWFLIGYPSFAAMEKDNDRAQANVPMTAELRKLTKGDADFISNSSTQLLALLPQLTYGPNVAIPMMRYIEVVTYRVRPGHDGDFMKAASMYREAAAKSNVDRPWAVYRTVSGTPADTYVVLLPMKSLSTWDRQDTGDAAIMGAMGERAGAFDKLVSDGIATTTSQVFEFSSKMSYVSKEWKAANPTFWK